MNVEGTFSLISKDFGTDANHHMFKNGMGNVLMNKNGMGNMLIMQNGTIKLETWFRGLYLLALFTEPN